MSSACPATGKTDGETLKAAGHQGHSGREGCGGQLHRGNALRRKDHVQAARRCPSAAAAARAKSMWLYDELLGEDGEVLDSHRFDMVEKLESHDARRALCLLAGRACPAASAATPAATYARPAPAKSACSTTRTPALPSKAAADSFEENMFHIIRAFHVAGRCTDCGECSRVCPQNIPLHLLNRKFIKDINDVLRRVSGGRGHREPRAADQLHQGRRGAQHRVSQGRGEIMLQLPIDKLQALFAAVAAKETLYIPADDAGRSASLPALCRRAMKMTKALNTVRSAKDFFFPQTEDLVDFKVKGKEIEIIDPRTEQRGLCDFRRARLRRTELRPFWTRCSSRRSGGQLLQVPPGARHRCDHGLHAAGGNLLLRRLSALMPANPEGDVRCWMTDDDDVLRGQHREGRSADRKPFRAADGGCSETACRSTQQERLRRSWKSCPCMS